MTPNPIAFNNSFQHQVSELSMKSRIQARRGFTLIELVVVILILVAVGLRVDA